MGHWIKLKASDGFELGAWRAEPKGAPRGVVGVIQEIFGVNAHIRSVADGYAADGYLAIAPAIFDRGERDVDLAYGPESFTRGLALVKEIPREATMLDIGAAVEAAKSAGKVGIVGYCLGGTLAWVAAAQLQGLSAAVGYYGGGIIGLKDMKPRVPTMLHFGEKDEHIPVAGVREIAAAHPDVPIHLYPAGHAFNRDVGAGYHAPSAALAKSRTLEFFAKHLG
ncbi:MAG: dienelactone hydrolase family protein [Roseiarcus sp.]